MTTFLQLIILSTGCFLGFHLKDTIHHILGTHAADRELADAEAAFNDHVERRRAAAMAAHPASRVA